MFEKNSLLFGLLVGLLFPVFGSAIVFGIFDLMVSAGIMDEAASGWMSKRMRTIILLGICTNVYWIRKYNHPFSQKTLQGVTFGTMVNSIIWLSVYAKDLFVEN